MEPMKTGHETVRFHVRNAAKPNVVILVSPRLSSPLCVRCAHQVDEVVDRGDGWRFERTQSAVHPGPRAHVLLHNIREERLHRISVRLAIASIGGSLIHDYMIL